MEKIIGFTLLIVIIGLTLGLALGGLNPWESPANARGIDLDNWIREQTYIQEQTQNQAQFEQEQAYREKQYAQDLINNQRVADAWIIFLTIFGSAFSIGVIIIAISIALQKVKAALKPSPELTFSNTQPEEQSVLDLEKNKYYTKYFELNDKHKKLIKTFEHIAQDRQYLDEENQFLTQENNRLRLLVENMKATKDQASISKDQRDNLPLVIWMNLTSPGFISIEIADYFHGRKETMVEKEGDTTHFTAQLA